jgi:hypothetical protein
MTDTARLRNVQAARKNSVDKVSDIGTCTRHGMRLSHARGRRMDGRGDGTAAAASCFAAMRSRIPSVFLRSTDIARVRLALASTKQRSQNQRCFGILPSVKKSRILTHQAPTAITCTGTHHEEPELEDHARVGWASPGCVPDNQGSRIGGPRRSLKHIRRSFCCTCPPSSRLLCGFPRDRCLKNAEHQRSRWDPTLSVPHGVAVIRCFRITPAGESRWCMLDGPGWG